MHTHTAFSLEKVRSFSERTAASDHWSNTCLCLLLPSLFSVSLNLKPWFQCLSLSLHTSKAIRKPNMEFKSLSAQRVQKVCLTYFNYL